MKVTPVNSPHQIQQAPAKDSRAKAIAAFQAASKQQSPAAVTSSNTPAQTTPVQNPNAISPEELGAIRPQTAQPIETTGDVKTGDEELITTSAEVTASEDRPQDRPEPAKPEVDPTLSKQFVQLARQEKALRAKAQQQEQAIKAREEALTAKETKITQLEQQYKSGYISLDKLKQDTLSVLANAGVSYDELTQQILSQGQTDPRMSAHISRLEAQIEELKAANETNKQSAQEQSEQQYDAAIRQIRTDAQKLINSDPNFETVKATGSVNAVVKLIESTYQEDGVIMSVEEATQLVEDELVERHVKISNLDKIKQRISQASAQAPKVTTKQTQAPAATEDKQTQPTMKTLTNAAASVRKLSAKERAILAFKGELRK